MLSAKNCRLKNKIGDKVKYRRSYWGIRFVAALSKLAHHMRCDFKINNKTGSIN